MQAERNLAESFTPSALFIGLKFSLLASNVLSTPLKHSAPNAGNITSYQHCPVHDCEGPRWLSAQSHSVLEIFRSGSVEASWPYQISESLLNCIPSFSVPLLTPLLVQAIHSPIGKILEFFLVLNKEYILNVIRCFINFFSCWIF